MCLKPTAGAVGYVTSLLLGAEFLKRLLTQDTSTRVAARSGHKIKALTVPHVPQKRHLCPKSATLHRKFIFNS